MDYPRSGISIHVSAGFSWDIALYILRRDLWPGGKSEVAKPVEWQEYDSDSAMSPELFVRLPRDAAQQLSDELYRAGFRPSDAIPAQGQVQAMENHIKDLQRMAFDRQPSDGIPVSPELLADLMSHKGDAV